MDLFESLRDDAELLHSRLVQEGADPLKPEEIINAAVRHVGRTLVWLEPTDPLLKGARALHDEQMRVLCCANEPDHTERLLLVAHEIGHVRLHGSTAICWDEDIDPSRSTEAAPVGLERVEDYGAHERRELQANVYGRELLLPRTLAHRLHAVEGLGAHEISTRLRLPINLVRQQILDALLLPRLPEPPDTSEPVPPVEDSSQAVAAVHRGSAFLLQAGPGAGKTRTLVTRLSGLLADNVDPASILALTFSNRAAGELAERITAIAPQAAPRVWIGTFHAFGLDLVRRYHDALDLPADPILFDRSDAIEVLEGILPTLPLIHYRNLWDPARVLRDIVGAISRAKDELVGPQRYGDLAQRMRENARDVDSRETAEKACEVAQVYALYERALLERKAVDFGDLIMRPALLLESDASIRTQIQLRHRHLLVDEYQDVNRASARLLRAVAGDGRRLWAVGDARQSIYRFRGASSANLPAFLKEYPDATTAQLGVNYRSSEEIVALFRAFSSEMAASANMLPLEMRAARGRTGSLPQVQTFETKDREIAGIAANIRALDGAGVPLREQAVLCHTNARLNEIAAGLEARGIPVVHLGSLFERSEIRDCLSLLSLAIDPHAAGLVRVATLPRYRMPLGDVQTATQICQSEKGAAIQKLAMAASDARLSPDGAVALARLAEDLRGLTGSLSSWEYLTTWLLDRTRHVAEMARYGGIAGRMRAVALWQFLNFVRTPGPPVQGPPIRRTLDRVRQLLLLNEERDLRQVPASALRMDAVRLMTVHGSKGLEFMAVHVPGLNSGGFPTHPKYQPCPPPLGMIEGPEAESDQPYKLIHAMEEECLFFVAASRAKKYLQLTRHAMQGSRRSSPSIYLTRISTSTAQGGVAEIPRVSEAVNNDRIAVHWPPGWTPTHADIQLYDKCARRFFYTRVLKLAVARKPTAFSLTYDCLYRVIEWLAESRLAGEPTLEATLQQFEKIWLEVGPAEHAYAADYHRLATDLVTALVRMGAGRRFRASEPLALDLPNGRVLVQPDEIAQMPDGAIVLRRLNSGRERSKEYDRLEYTLYILAGRTHFGSSCRFEAVHLTDGERVHPVSVTDDKVRNRRQTTDTLLKNLMAGEFPPDPEPVVCARCPHFFVCDAVAHGPITPVA